MYRRRDRSCDSSHGYNLDRRHGSSWRDNIYPSTGPSNSRDSKEEIKDSSFIRDSAYTKTDPTFTDREIPVIKESYQDSSSTQNDTSLSQRHCVPSSYTKTSTTYTGEIPVVKETPVDSANIQTDSQPKKDSFISPFAKIGTLQADKIIPVIKETPEDSVNTQDDTSEANKDSCASSHTHKANLEIPLIREAPKAPYSANRETETKRDSAFIETDTSQLKRDSADSGAPDHETGKCKRVRVLREDSPEGVSVPIIRTDQPNLGTRGDQKEEAGKVQKLSPDDKNL